MNLALRRGFVLMLLLAVAPLPSAQAHEVRPGYLEVRQVDAEAFDVLWKVPAKGEYRLRLHARMPGECTGEPSHGSFVAGAFVERWRAICPGGLSGRSIDIEGLSATRTDVLARIQWSDGTVQAVRVTPEHTSFVAQAAPGALAVSKTYLVLGVEHILLGIDHLLFVVGLLFLAGNWRRLIATVTAFTVAHSITLAAATLGLVHVAQAPVEAAIALSIVFVAAEIVRGTHGGPRLSGRAPWLVALVFGLLHGFGFAGALREIGLPQTDVPLALLFFNVGVEIGQLLFIAVVVAVFSSLAWLARRSGWRTQQPWHSAPLNRTVVAYGIGSAAAFWTVQRVVGFWPPMSS
jgi:hydrogenase/urease accessory protein HupE